MPAPDPLRLRTPLPIWWILCGSYLAGLLILYVLLGRGPFVPPAPGANPFANLAGLVPLFVSIVIRWLVLPRSPAAAPALVMFIIGLSLAETCGVLGILLGGPYREDLFILGVLGVVQYAPFYARKFYAPPAEGFYPNRG